MLSGSIQFASIIVISKSIQSPIVAFEEEPTRWLANNSAPFQTEDFERKTDDPTPAHLRLRRPNRCTSGCDHDAALQVLAGTAASTNASVMELRKIVERQLEQIKRLETTRHGRSSPRKVAISFDEHGQSNPTSVSQLPTVLLQSQEGLVRQASPTAANEIPSDVLERQHSTRKQKARKNKPRKGKTHKPKKEEKEEEEDEEEEEETYEGIGVSTTLIFGISFIMMIQYMTNSHDDDIRRYIWDVIYNTVSIFCAVMLFRGIQAVIVAELGQHASGVGLLCAGISHMFFWCLGLHLWLGYYPGQKGYAIIMTRITCFAAINAWGSIQQMDDVRSSNAKVLLVVPIAAIGSCVCVKICSFCVELYSTAHPMPPKHHEDAEKYSIEAENEIIAYALGFLTVQAVRLAITGTLPTITGHEDVTLGRTMSQSLQLLLFGVISLGAATVTFWEEEVLFDESDGGGEASQTEKRSSTKRASKRLSIEQADAVAKAGESGAEQEDLQNEDGEDPEVCQEAAVSVDEVNNPLGVHRIMDALVHYLTMNFAFSIFFSGQWFVESRLEVEETMLYLIVAMVLSTCAFAGIYILNSLEDWYLYRDPHTGEVVGKLHKVIVQLVTSFGLVVAFGWQRSFEVAIIDLCEPTPHPALSQLGIAIFCSILLIPAWRQHMLPMVLHKGWRFNIVVHGHWTEEDIQDCIEWLKNQMVEPALKEIRHQYWSEDLVGLKNAHKSLQNLVARLTNLLAYPEDKEQLRILSTSEEYDGYSQYSPGMFALLHCAGWERAKGGVEKCNLIFTKPRLSELILERAALLDYENRKMATLEMGNQFHEAEPQCVLYNSLEIMLGLVKEEKRKLKQHIKHQEHSVGGGHEEAASQSEELSQESD